MEASVSRPATDPAAAAATTPTPAMGAGLPEPCSELVDVGRPERNQPVAAAAEADVAGAKSPRRSGLEALPGPGRPASGTDPAGPPRGRPPFAVNVLPVLGLERFRAPMSSNMLVNDSPEWHNAPAARDATG